MIALRRPRLGLLAAPQAARSPRRGRRRAIRATPASTGAARGHWGRKNQAPTRTATAVRRPRLGLLAAWGAVAATGLAGAYVAAAQWHNRYPPDFVWPQQFEPVHVVGVLAILSVGVEVVREAVAAPRSHGSGRPLLDRPRQGVLDELEQGRLGGRPIAGVGDDHRHLG